MIGIIILYRSNEGWAAFGPFDHVDKAVAWARRELPNEKFYVVPLNKGD